MAPKTVKKHTPFRQARNAGVPIVAIESADPAATMDKCAQALNGSHDITPQLRWDIVRGLTPINKPGAVVFSRIAGQSEGSDPVFPDPVLCMAKLVEQHDKLSVTPEEDCGKPDEEQRHIGCIVYMLHANRWLDELAPMQAVWNIRDTWKTIGCTLVLIGPTIKLPSELKNDVILISEPLPGHDELDRIVGRITGEEGANLKEEQIGDRELVVDTMSGTSAFGAEQILSMSLTKDGIDNDQLWERKRKMIEQTPGLKVRKVEGTFDDLGGMENLKQYLRDILTSGVSPIRLIVFQDEIEKAIQGATGGALDGGTSADQLKVVLTLMADRKMPGIILVGHGGCGKSEIATAAGAIAKCPVIDWDFGAMKEGVVGSSEHRIREAVEVVKAVSDCKCLFIATCNKIDSLPPELRRRYKLGTFFCDLPTPEEQDKIWRIWMKKFSIEKQPLPECNGWTGAEIAACCEGAWRTGKTLRQASTKVVPVILSNPGAVESLRKLAHNSFIDASKDQYYQYSPKTVEPQKTGRKMEL
ncbi:AAA family ATPase [Patescibacteria group bacterium]|nr:AAA family ATPase [Patescibacteria group bacterium]